MRQPVVEEDLKDISAALANSVMSLKGRRLFLTGGTGFFGKWLTGSFLHLNNTFGLDASLTILSRDPRSFLACCPWLKTEAALNFVQGDIRDFQLPSEKYEFIIHAATEASVKLEQEDPAEMFDVIVAGTRRVLEFAAQTGAARVMLASSGAVYGAQPPEIDHMFETYHGTPQTAYGKGKVQAEQLCVEAGQQCGLAALLPRCFAFVGPYLPLDAHFAIGNFIRDCLADRPIVIQGDGTPLRSYLYAADLAEWLWTILLRGEHARPYNVGSGDAISIGDLAHLVRECAGTQNEIVVHGKKTEGSLPARYVPSVERAEKELGLTARYPLEEAIRRTLAWHRRLTDP